MKPIRFLFSVLLLAILSGCQTPVTGVDATNLAQTQAETQQMYYMTQYLQASQIGHTPVIEFEGELRAGPDGKMPRITLYEAKNIEPIRQFSAEDSSGAKWLDTIVEMAPWLVGGWVLTDGDSGGSGGGGEGGATTTSGSSAPQSLLPTSSTTVP